MEKVRRKRVARPVGEDDIITLENVTKSYSTGAPALNGVTLHIKKGEFVFIVGDSGSGKSTLIKLLLRELVPSDGKITVMGQDLGRMRHRNIPKFRRKLGIVFQDFRLLMDRNVMRTLHLLRESFRNPQEKSGKMFRQFWLQLALPENTRAR